MRTWLVAAALFFCYQVSAQKPVISSFSPLKAALGQTVTIQGSHFTGATAVYLGNTKPASFTVMNDNIIKAVVGRGASGFVKVTTPAGADSAKGFIYISAPVITGFSPQAGAIGITVTINGNFFNSKPDSNIVFFGAAKAQVTGASQHSITVKVPAGASYQPISVLTLDGGLSAYTAKPFTTTFAGATNQTGIALNSGYSFNSKAGQGNNDIAVGDLDGDGRPDIVTSSGIGNSVSVYRNTSAAGAFSTGALDAPLTLPTGLTPVSVHLVDMNGDGKPDIIATNINAFSIDIFQNISTAGHLSFGPRVSVPVVNSATTIGDVDGDGRPDIATLTLDSSITVFRNNIVNGTISVEAFQESAHYSAGLKVTSMAFTDIDGDGKQDLIASNREHFISVFKNKTVPGSITDTSFVAAVNVPVNTGTERIVVADLDNDGKNDLVLIDGNSDSLIVVQNKSAQNIINAASFATPVYFYTGKGLTAVKAGDIDGDGKPDIAAANSTILGLTVLKNISTPGTIKASSFLPASSLGTGELSFGLAIADLDNDGPPEIATANYNPHYFTVIKPSIVSKPPVISSFTSPAGYHNTVTIKGRYFTSALKVSLGDTAAVSFTVLSDTVITAIAGNGATGKIIVTTSLGTAQASGFVYVAAPAIKSFLPAEAGPFDTVVIKGANFIHVDSVHFGNAAAIFFNVLSDTVLKAIPGKGLSGSITVFTPYGTGARAGFTYLAPPVISRFTPDTARMGDTVNIYGANFKRVDSVLFGGTRAAYFSIAADTLLKAVVATGSTGSVAVYTKSGTTSHAAFVFINTPPVINSITPSAAPAGTVVEIAGKYFSPTVAGNTVRFGPVKATVVAASSALLRVIVPTGASYTPVSITANTLTGVSPGSFIVTFPGASTHLSYKNFITGITVNTVDNPLDAVAEDLDGDGKPEAVIVNQSSFSVYKNQSIAKAVAFGSPVTFPVQYPPQGALFADFDGDGYRDIALVNKSDGYGVSVFKNTGQGNSINFAFVTAPMLAGFGPFQFAIGDINSDGKPDVVASTYYGVVFTLLNTSANGVISFAEPQAIYGSRGAEFNKIAVADLDGDGKPELLVTYYTNNGYLQNTILVVPNTSNAKGVSFGAAISVGVQYGPYSVTTGDLDGDGKPDIVVSDIYKDYVSVIRNTSTLGAFSFAPALDTRDGYQVRTVLLNDVDGDGKPDIVAAAGGNNQIDVLKNTSTPGMLSFQEDTDFPTGGIDIDQFSVADMTGDGKPDMLVPNYNSKTFVVLANIIGGTTLPVTLLSFTAQHAKNDVYLQWQTAAEKNTRLFDVERSANGIDFIKIGTVPAAGNTTAANTYSWLDAAPPAGNHYYRLKMMDADGKFTYSNTILLSTTEANTLNVYPNPAHSFVNVHHPIGSGASIELYNAAGKRVKTAIAAANTTVTVIQVGDLAAGLYTVTWTNGVQTLQYKIIKQ